MMTLKIKKNERSLYQERGISDNELEVLPSNEEEEKEEILLTTTKSLKKPSEQSQKKAGKNYTFNRPTKSTEQTKHSIQ
jgi:hypothetical protein